MMTIARMPTLTFLNHSSISTAERQNAEIQYLNIVKKHLSLATNAVEVMSLLRNNPRYGNLCTIYDVPAAAETGDKAKMEPAAGTLVARMINFSFYITEADLRAARGTSGKDQQDHEIPNDVKVIKSDDDTKFFEKAKLIPRSVDVYRLKGIVGRMFDIKPMICKLIWETGEFDPIKENDDDDGWSIDEDQDQDESMGGIDNGCKTERDVDGGKIIDEGRDMGKWQKREEELVDGTKEVGNWIEKAEARVRIEKRELE